MTTEPPSTAAESDLSLPLPYNQRPLTKRRILCWIFTKSQLRRLGLLEKESDWDIRLPFLARWKKQGDPTGRRPVLQYMADDCWAIVVTSNVASVWNPQDLESKVERIRKALNIQEGDEFDSSFGWLPKATMADAVPSPPLPIDESKPSYYQLPTGRRRALCWMFSIDQLTALGLLPSICADCPGIFMERWTSHGYDIEKAPILYYTNFCYAIVVRTNERSKWNTDTLDEDIERVRNVLNIKEGDEFDATFGWHPKLPPPAVDV